jgi:penicillin-binding protein 1C
MRLFFKHIKNQLKPKGSIKKSYGGKFSIVPDKASKYDKKLEILNSFISILTIGVTILIVGILGIFVIYAKDLPDPNRLSSKGNESGTKLLDKNDKVIFELYGDKNRVLIQLNQVPEDVIKATLATEDAEFYRHSGFSLRGMARAVRNTITGQGLQGGSTITQQVVKNSLLSQERTIDRKIKELILSLQIESKYTKDDILQMYFNETPYGGQNYGIFAASKAYFAKDPGELTLSESAYLAGLPQRPSYYSPFSSNKEAGIERRNLVLNLMRYNGWVDKNGNRVFISEEEYNQALNEKIEFKPSAAIFKAPHFVFYIKDKLIEMYGEEVVETAGLQVKTTLDLDVQENAEKIMSQVLDKEKVYGVGNSAMVVYETNTGKMLAMIGSKNYFGRPEPKGCESATTGEKGCKFDPYFNVATASRQPGSAIKPLTYAGLLEKGFTPSFTFLDVPTTFTGEGVGSDKAYTPVNYDGIYRGPVSLRKSLGNSLNIPAVKALGILGLDSFLELSQKMGISTFTDKTRFGLSITLGGAETKLFELTSAYTVFGNQGIYNSPVAILEVKDNKGNELFRYQEQRGVRVISEETAFLISDILSDDGARSDAFGFNSPLKIPNHQVAVKTGTTNNKRDNYAIGYSPSHTVGVWVGNSNNEPLNPSIASGISGATPIWSETMKFLLKDKPKTGENVEKFNPTSNLSKIEIDERSGMLPYKDNPKRSEWFVKGTEPQSPSEWYKTIEVCEFDGRIANESCKEADKTKTKNYIGILDYKPDWQNYTDSWLQEKYSGDETYFPPTITSRLEYDGKDPEEMEPYIRIVAPKENSSVPSIFRISTEISASSKIKEVKFYLDSSQVGTDSSYPYGYTFKLNKNQLGSHKFKAKVVDRDGGEGDHEITLNVLDTLQTEQ